MSDAIRNGKVVQFHYTLTGLDGKVIESSRRGMALPYLHGTGSIVPGLERAMESHVVGDNFQVTVQPEDAYGETSGTAPQALPRDSFPPGKEIDIGMVFMAESPNGEQVPIWVNRVEKETIWMTLDHPLAGKVLVFDVEIMGVREATPDELEHGHPHDAGLHY